MWFRWKDGRQGGGYSKFALCTSKHLKFDLYLLRLPTGTEVKPHIDPAPIGFEHHRINLTLRFAKKGGLTLIAKQAEEQCFRYEAARLYRFRPDLNVHFLTQIKEGSMLILSLGWLKKIDHK